MTWEDIDNDINSLEKESSQILREIDIKEQTSQKRNGDIEEENKKLLRDIEALKKENSSLENELFRILRQNEDLKKTFGSLQENVTKSESSCTSLRNSLVINDSDNLRMKKAREMLQVGKDFTRVRWDYSAPQNICKGYIGNKDIKSFECFEFDKSKMTDEEIQEHLWNRSEATSSTDWSDLTALSESGEVIHDKENVQKNL